MKRQFTKEDTQTASKHTHRHSTSLAIREMKIKTTMRHPYPPIRIAKKKKKKMTPPDSGKDGAHHVAGGNVKGSATLGTVWQFLRKLNMPTQTTK